jgi:hypothetical protein
MKIPFGQQDPPGASAKSAATAAVGASAIPIVTGLNPNRGPAAGGNTVTITGTSLTGATAVKFGTTPAAFTVVSNSQINAVAPARAAGTAQVTVTTSGGTSNGLTYTYVTVPVITTLTPTQGPTAGGNTVTITGANLTGVTSVRFDGVSAAFTAVSGTQVTAIAPSHCAGAAEVIVTTAGGTSTPAVYFFAGVPATTGLHPDKGPTVDGTTVTITGSGLLGASQVQFGGTNATAFTVVSDSQIDATVPARPAGLALVSVTTPGGTASGSYYECVAAPVVDVVSPNAGPVWGGNGVTITGSGLTFASAVRFGTTLASFAVFSDTQAIAIAPPGTGTIQLTLTTPGGVSDGTAYTYAASPMV